MDKVNYKKPFVKGLVPATVSFLVTPPESGRALQSSASISNIGQSHERFAGNDAITMRATWDERCGEQ